MENGPGVVSKIIDDYPKRSRTSNSERADWQHIDFCPCHFLFTLCRLLLWTKIRLQNMLCDVEPKQREDVARKQGQQRREQQLCANEKR
jgi:hypothetical protein